MPHDVNMDLEEAHSIARKQETADEIIQKKNEEATKKKLDQRARVDDTEDEDDIRMRNQGNESPEQPIIAPVETADGSDDEDEAYEKMTKQKRRVVNDDEENEQVTDEMVAYENDRSGDKDEDKDEEEDGEDKDEEEDEEEEDQLDLEDNDQSHQGDRGKSLSVF